MMDLLLKYVNLQLLNSFVHNISLMLSVEFSLLVHLRVQFARFRESNLIFVSTSLSRLSSVKGHLHL